MPFFLTSLPDADLLYIAGAGQIDDTTVRDVTHQTLAHVEDGESRRLLVDFRDIRSLDVGWETIKACVDLHRDALEEAGGDACRIGVIGRGTVDSVVVRVYNSFLPRAPRVPALSRITYTTSIDEAMTWLEAGDSLRQAIVAQRTTWGLSA